MSQLEPFLEFDPDYVLDQDEENRDYYKKKGEKPRPWSFGRYCRRRSDIFGCSSGAFTISITLVLIVQYRRNLQIFDRSVHPWWQHHPYTRKLPSGWPLHRPTDFETSSSNEWVRPSLSPLADSSRWSWFRRSWVLWRQSFTRLQAEDWGEWCRKYTTIRDLGASLSSQGIYSLARKSSLGTGKGIAADWS